MHRGLVCPHASPFVLTQRHRDDDSAELVCRLWDLERPPPARAGAEARVVHGDCVLVASARPLPVLQAVCDRVGASVSVLSFNCVAAALCFLIVSIGRAGATHFYGDFSVLEADVLADSAKEFAMGSLSS